MCVAGVALRPVTPPMSVQLPFVKCFAKTDVKVGLFSANAMKRSPFETRASDGENADVVPPFVETLPPPTRSQLAPFQERTRTSVSSAHAMIGLPSSSSSMLGSSAFDAPPTAESAPPRFVHDVPVQRET